MSDHPVAHPSAIDASERILVRGVNWLGDAVMTTPALLRLREARPQAHLTLLTHEKLADLWRHHPAVDEVIPFPSGAGVLDVARKIRAGRFDVGVLFPNSHRSALELRLGGVPVRIGAASPLRKILLTDPVSRPPGLVSMRKRSLQEIKKLVDDSGRSKAPAPNLRAHHLHHYLHLLVRLGVNPQPLPPRLVVEEPEIRAAVIKFVPDFWKESAPAESTPGTPVFALCPGAEYGPAKRWPAQNFVAAARELSRRTGCRWIIFGGPGEVELGNEVAVGVGGQVRNLAGRTSLRELMALLRFCRVALSNDTGPMHLAAAVGTRVAAIFGSTSPELTGPGLPGDSRHRLIASSVACSPCFLRKCPIDFRCMNRIGISQVVNAMLELHEQNESGK